uniref:AIG1-type G domain-containing protein n=1 Tax=Amphimedon queenslandica TaxID=400682 RepID=A0A1X7V3B2_AMPQE
MATPLVDPLEDITSPSEIPSQENVTDVPLDDKYAKKSAKLKRRKHHVKILVMGLTGAGKSSLINSMMGSMVTVAQAGANPVQRETQYYKGEHDGIKVKIYDTPGFGDETLPSKDILKDIFSKNAPKKGYDLILIALRMDNRFDMNIDMLSSLKRGQYMDRGKKWERTIVVLTFANAFVDQLKNNPQQYTEEQMKDEIQKQKEEFQERFQKHTGKNDIPFVLAGKAVERKLPTDDDWLVTLWEQSVLQSRTKAKPFLKRLGIFRLINQLQLKLRSLFFTSNEESADINGPEEFRATLEGGSDSEGENKESSSSEEEGGRSTYGSLQHDGMDLEGVSLICDSLKHDGMDLEGVSSIYDNLQRDGMDLFQEVEAKLNVSGNSLKFK